MIALRWRALLALFLAVATFFTLRLFGELPRPTGPHRVGTKSIHVIDQSRRETFRADAEARRELMVQLWYPTSAAAGDTAPYAADQQRRSLLARLRFPRTHAWRDAPVAPDAPWPLLIFSPAWDGQRWQNTAQCEELASHGFIVAGIDHTFGAAATAFPDGRVVRADPSLALDFSTDAAYAKFLENGEAQLRLRVQDVRFVLDEMLRMNAEPGWLHERIDVQRVGVFGHSFGGAVAAEVCIADARFKAAIDMDGCIFGAARSVGMSQPFLLLFDDTQPPTPQQIASDRYARFIDRGFRDIDGFLERSHGTQIMIRGAGHANFSDAPLLASWRGGGRTRGIGARRAAEIVNACTLAFFEKTLLQKPAPLLDAVSKVYPEAELKTFAPR